MIEKDERKILPSPFRYIVILAIFIATFLSFSMILLLINKKILIDKNSVDILDMYIKASFVLIGSTLSGLVALFIFYLQERSKREDKKENEKKHYENIYDEFADNIEVYKKLSNIMRKDSLSQLATEIVEEQELKEILLVLYTQLNFTFYIEYLKELKSEEYANCIKAFKFAYQIYNYLGLVINKLDNKENIETILRLIKEKMDKINEFYNK